MGEGSGIWRRGKSEDLSKASAADDVEAVFCAERESAMVVTVKVLVGEGDVIKACIEGGLTERRTGGRFVSLGGGLKMNEACVCGENTGRGW